MIAIRKALENLVPNRGQFDSHPGLLLQRYLHKSATGDSGDSEQKKQIFQAAISASKNSTLLQLYNVAYQNWKQSFMQLTIPEFVREMELQTVGRLIVGLGTENVLETGIRLHHTYGIPILPGSALKGLAAHYCHSVWGEQDPKFKKDSDYHRLLFGTTEESGCIVFHDGWFVPDSDKEPLKLDVMTPHHTDWNNIENPVAPTDFDSPIPVPFLSVSGDFYIAVSWYGPTEASTKQQSSRWLDIAAKLLREALFEWGIGGKTTSGYGLFDRQKWITKETEEQKKAEEKKVAEEKKAAMEAMSPLDQKVWSFLQNHKNKAEKREWFKLLEELKKQDSIFDNIEEKKLVAARIKKDMQEAKVWRDKDKDGERKKFIESILAQ